MAKHSEFHEVTKKSNFNPITGQRYGGNRFRSSDTVTDNASTGAVVNPNNAVLEKCDIERVVNFPWCDSGINPWNLCILTGKTKTEMHNILRLDNLDIDKPSV